jgi:trimeric autotransporter adhesin
LSATNTSVFAGYGSGTTGVANSFVGQEAGNANTTGGFNSFFGSAAGRLSTTGSSNSFFGAGSGGSNTGDSNSFFGVLAGEGNTTGGSNSYIGSQAGGLNTTGSFNALFGLNAGFDNQTGSFNTIVGARANVASGALANATAIGSRAMVGQSNSMVLGSISGVNSATSSTSVGIGTTMPRGGLEVSRNWDGAFGSLTVTGDRPTIRFSSNNAVSANQQWILHLGGAAGTVPAGSLSFFNGGTGGTAYGSPVFAVTPSGTVIFATLGSAGSTSLCRNASNEIASCSSSLRYKKNINPFSSGLAFVSKLRPVAFDWKDGGMKDIGFGAEDVAKIDPRFVTYNDKGEIEGVKYDRLTTVFVNAFKEQQAQIERQQKEIEQLKKHVAEMDALKKLVCMTNKQAEICKE